MRPSSSRSMLLAISVRVLSSPTFPSRVVRVSWRPRASMPSLSRSAGIRTTSSRWTFMYTGNTHARFRSYFNFRARSHEEGRQDEGDRGKELHEDMEGRPRCILKRIADGVPHDGRLVLLRPLPGGQGLDVLLRVVPRAPSRIEDEGEHDARDRADHQSRAEGLPRPEARGDADELEREAHRHRGEHR